jgi:hypothetical protein
VQNRFFLLPFTLALLDGSRLFSSKSGYGFVRWALQIPISVSGLGFSGYLLASFPIANRISFFVCFLSSLFQQTGELFLCISDHPMPPILLCPTYLLN